MTPPTASHAVRREQDDVKLTIFGQTLELSGKVARSAWPWLLGSLLFGAATYFLFSKLEKISDKVDVISERVAKLESSQEFIKEIITRRRNR